MQCQDRRSSAGDLVRGYSNTGKTRPFLKNGQQIRTHLKIRVFVRDQGEAESQPGGILKYVEDLRRGFNADIG